MIKKSIKTIFISNILEGFYQSYKTLPPKQRSFWISYDSMEGNRALLYNSDDKAVITSYEINPLYFKNISQLMNWKNVWNLTPKKTSYSICQDCINNNVLNNQLVNLIKTNPGINIIPYRSTPEFQLLICHLNSKNLKFTTPETIPPDHQFTLNYFNTKRGFRHLWHLAFFSSEKSNHKIPIPEGFITGNREEAIEAAWWFKQQKRSFVIKYNRGVQGMGIILNNQSTFPNNKKEFSKKLSLLLKENIWNEPSIIVEELIDIDNTNLSGSPNVELFIKPNGKTVFSYACEQILDRDKKTFRGIYIYPELIKNRFIKAASKAGQVFSHKLASYGYRGCFDIDLVVSKDQKVYAVEANLRRTGGTHIHEAIVSLLGKNYWRSFYVLNEDIMLSNGSDLSYDKCLSIFADILFDKKSQSGIIFSNPDMLKVNVFNYILIGHSHEQIQSFRQLVKKRLTPKYYSP